MERKRIRSFADRRQPVWLAKEPPRARWPAAAGTDLSARNGREATGISGQFYRQFAPTIAGATIISLIVSLTLSPAMCALLLKPRHNGQRVSERGPARTASRRSIRWCRNIRNLKGGGRVTSMTASDTKTRPLNHARCQMELRLDLAV
jgi:hypothetical protein